MATTQFFFLLLVAVAATFPTIEAHIAQFDELWKARAERAKEAAIKAYESDPSKVTAALNTEVRRTLESIRSNATLAKHFHLPANSTRRYLRGKLKATDHCVAANPIDRCWRCQPDWHMNRKRLADCVLGFGYKTTGGKDGAFYVVTDHTDDCTKPKPGTLRHAVIQKEPLWIIFAKSMRIRLTQELMVQSHKTIDGRGAHVTIAAGAGITLQFVQNVIIHNIHIVNIQVGTGGMVRDATDHVGFRTVSDGDGISIFGSSNIWLDHLSMSNCRDGLIDAIEGSTGITISNSHFTDHNEVMLFGARESSSQDEIMQITVAFNHFGKRLIQRMPRCRFGLFHVVNNDYTHWNMYAIGGSMHPTIISQGNRFIAPDNIRVKEITKREASKGEWQHWIWRSQGDLMMNGAFFVESGDPNGVQRLFSKMEGKAQVTAEPGTSVTMITRFAGFLSCTEGRPC